MYKLIVGAVFSLLLLDSAAMAQCTSYPNTLTNGTTADANQVMANFNCAALTSGSTITGLLSISGENFIHGTDDFVGTDNVIGLHSNKYLYLQGNTAGGLVLAAASNRADEITIRNTSHEIDFATNDSAVAQIIFSSSGYIGVGTTSITYPLTVNGTAYATGAAGALSDIRHKKDVAPLEDRALDKIMHLRPVSFFWKEPRDDGMKGRQMGFIAQEVEQVLPTVVLTENNAEKTKGLKYNEIVAVLTKAVQEQQAEIKSLEAVNDNNKALVSRLETRLFAVEHQARIQTAQR